MPPPQQFTGKVEFLNSNGDVILTVDPDNGLYPIVLKTADGETVLSTIKSGLLVGAVNNAGSISVHDEAGRPVFRLFSSTGHLYVGHEGQFGQISILDANGVGVIDLAGFGAMLRVGQQGNAGDIRVVDHAGGIALSLVASNAALYVGAAGGGNEGDIVVRDGDGRNVFHVNGNTAALRIGVDGKAGVINVRDHEGRTTLSLVGLTGDLRVGTKGRAGRITVMDAGGSTRVSVFGDDGDIILANADCAEEFEVSTQADVEPGTVMVLGHDSRLSRSTEAYDRRVAGVISGAGNAKPAIILGRKLSRKNRMPLALVGKTFCKADASYAPIEIGDLLTTSPTPGHAMKVVEPKRALGAVIGKALHALHKGKGLIPILIALQ